MSHFLSVHPPSDITGSTAKLHSENQPAANVQKYPNAHLQIHSGQPTLDYIDHAVRHVLLRQGVLGIRVKIMLDWDPSGKVGPKNPLPDMVTILEPKEEETIVPPVATA